MKEENKQVATQNQNVDLPAYVSQQHDTGIDVFNNDDVITPRIKICQPTSSLKDSIPNLKDGDWYCPGMSMVFGSSIEMYVLAKFDARVWYSNDFKLVGYYAINPRTKVESYYGEKIEEIMNDKDLWESGQDSYNYMVILADELRECIKHDTQPTVFIYSAASAARGPAKKLNTMLMANARKNVPMFANLIKAGTVAKQFEKGRAFMPEFHQDIGITGFAVNNEFEQLKIGHQLARKELDKGDIHEEFEKAEEAERAKADVVNQDGSNASEASGASEAFEL